MKRIRFTATYVQEYNLSPEHYPGCETVDDCIEWEKNFIKEEPETFFERSKLTLVTEELDGTIRDTESSGAEGGQSSATEEQV